MGMLLDSKRALLDFSQHTLESASMSKRLMYLSGLLFICVVSAVGCENKQQTELIDYINKELPAIAELEEKVFNKYSAVSGDNYSDDQVMQDALRSEIIPNSSKLIDTTEAVVIVDKQLRHTHEIYISAINKQHNAFNLIDRAIDTADAEMINKANNLLSEARKGMRDFLSEINKLKTEYNVVTK